jgi:hypothetical protein
MYVSTGILGAIAIPLRDLTTNVGKPLLALVALVLVASIYCASRANDKADAFTTVVTGAFLALVLFVIQEKSSACSRARRGQ